MTSKNTFGDFKLQVSLRNFISFHFHSWKKDSISIHQKFNFSPTKHLESASKLKIIHCLLKLVLSMETLFSLVIAMSLWLRSSKRLKKQKFNKQPSNPALMALCRSIQLQSHNNKHLQKIPHRRQHRLNPRKQRTRYKTSNICRSILIYPKAGRNVSNRTLRILSVPIALLCLPRDTK